MDRILKISNIVRWTQKNPRDLFTAEFTNIFFLCSKQPKYVNLTKKIPYLSSSIVSLNVFGKLLDFFQMYVVEDEWLGKFKFL